MNVGQILETHLGMAARGSVSGSSRCCVRRATSRSVKSASSWDRSTIQPVAPVEELDSLSDEEVIALAKNLKAGVPMATPVFDGAREHEIKHLLKLAGLPESGQMTLYDGRTGEASTDR